MQNQPDSKVQEVFKTHWKTIALTTVLTSFTVGIGGVIYGVYSSSKIPNQNTSANQISPTNSQSTTDLKIKGNKNSKIYHLKGCPNYDDIAEKNIVWFKTEEEAEAAGYRKARNC